MAIAVDLEEGQMEALKLKLHSLGYPLVTDDLSTLQTLGTTAKSFVSCAIAKRDERK